MKTHAEHTRFHGLHFIQQKCPNTSNPYSSSSATKIKALSFPLQIFSVHNNTPADEDPCPQGSKDRNFRRTYFNSSQVAEPVPQLSHCTKICGTSSPCPLMEREPKVERGSILYCPTASVSGSSIAGGRPWGSSNTSLNFSRRRVSDGSSLKSDWEGLMRSLNLVTSAMFAQNSAQDCRPCSDTNCNGPCNLSTKIKALSFPLQIFSVHNKFFSRFTVPRSQAKWSSRLKCNLYYYRTNYFLMIIFILGMGFLRRPLAIVAAVTTAMSIAFLNDSFAATFSEKITRSVRQFSPHLAAKLRAPLAPVIRGRPSAKRAIFICGRPRWVFVLAFAAVSFFLWIVSCGALMVLWALAIGLLATVLHASFRIPNLKARLNTFREEFRAVWRNYSDL